MENQLRHMMAGSASLVTWVSVAAMAVMPKTDTISMPVTERPVMGFCQKA